MGDGVGVGSPEGSGRVGSDDGSPDPDGSAGVPLPSGSAGASDAGAEADASVGAGADEEAAGTSGPDGPSVADAERESVTGTTVGASTGPGPSGSVPDEADGTGPAAEDDASLTYSEAPLSPPGSMASSARLSTPSASTTPTAVSSSARPRLRWPRRRRFAAPPRARRGWPRAPETSRVSATGSVSRRERSATA
ncbi:hypothetical protein ADK82_01305 [Streptomyces sp. NRRL S-4]|nr:hypothetical protein ADK82_01305 [Streptomyces sp. NRRL S-4]